MRTRFLLTAASILLLAACAGDPREERMARNAVVLNLGTDPRTLDPSLSTDVASSRAILHMMRGLTVLDADGHPRPELAREWTISPDGLTYTFKLRATDWTNGYPLRPDDFVYAWTQRVLRPEFGCEYAYQMFYVKGAKAYYEAPSRGPESVGVRAIDAETLQVELEAPTPFFLELLAHHTYYPVCEAAVRENPNWAVGADTYVGIGPFDLIDYEPGHLIELARNPAYWNAEAVGMDRVTLVMIEQESTARIAFDNGELDATMAVPRADIDQLRSTPALRFAPMHSIYYLYFNCQREIMRDVRVRRALALAIDRRAITDRILRAGEQPAFGIVPPALWSDPPRPTWADAAFDEARRLLAEAGYPGGEGFPELRYIYNMLETHRQIAQVIQRTWKQELGIEIAIESQEFKVLIDSRRKGEFDVARAGWVADFADPINFLEIFTSGSENNDAFWFDEHFDGLLARARREPDPARREAILKQAAAYFIEHMPAAPIYIYTNPYLCAPELQGYEMNPMGMFRPEDMRWE